jgi:hypothetical protein
MFGNIFKFINKHLALLRILLISILAVTIFCGFVNNTIIQIDSTDTLIFDYDHMFVQPEPLTADSSAETINPVRLNTPIFFENICYNAIYNIETALSYLKTIEESQEVLSNEIESGAYSSLAILAMEDEINRLIDIYNKIKMDIIRYNAYKSEYGYATDTYLFLKQCGYSDAVACGIIGNMMIETSGGTLEINPYIYGPNREYYGLCQWRLEYYPGADTWSFEQQLDFLYDSMPREFNVFGKLYMENYTYDDFLQESDPSEAAYIFARVYERCGSISFNMRRQAALDAYDYFCSE